MSVSSRPVPSWPTWPPWPRRPLCPASAQCLSSAEVEYIFDEYHLRWICIWRHMAPVVGRWARWSGANGQDRHKAQGLGARLLNIDCTQSGADSWRATMKIEAHCKTVLQNVGNKKGSGTQNYKIQTMQLIYFTNKFHLRDITTPYWYNFFWLNSEALLIRPLLLDSDHVF